MEIIESWSRSSDPVTVANELQLSIHTVQTHLKRLRKKLGVHKTAQVALLLLHLLEVRPAGMDTQGKPKTSPGL